MDTGTISRKSHTQTTDHLRITILFHSFFLPSRNFLPLSNYLVYLLAAIFGPICDKSQHISEEYSYLGIESAFSSPPVGGITYHSPPRRPRRTPRISFQLVSTPFCKIATRGKISKSRMNSGTLRKACVQVSVNLRMEIPDLVTC